MISAVRDDAPRTPLHGGADADSEEIEGDQVKSEEDGPVTTKSPR